MESWHVHLKQPYGITTLYLPKSKNNLENVGKFWHNRLHIVLFLYLINSDVDGFEPPIPLHR